MKTNWSKYQIGYDDQTPLIEIDVHMTPHAADRAAYRDGKPVGLTKDTIQKIVDAAESKILQLGTKYQTTIILKTSNAINIVGSLAKKASDWVFDIITVMIKKNFVPKNAFDKVVYVNESSSGISSLVQIIERIESDRVGKISKLQHFSVGSKVQYKQLLGEVVEISPNRTSVIVMFPDQSKKRFFMNKRANRETLNELSLCKIIRDSEKSNENHK